VYVTLDRVYGIPYNRVVRLRRMREAEMFAYYTEEGIWSTGASPEAAIEDFLHENHIDPDEVKHQMDTAPMTARLAERVEHEGYDVYHPAYSFRLLPDGSLDLDLES
jgi:hypothetical protein